MSTSAMSATARLKLAHNARLLCSKLGGCGHPRSQRNALFRLERTLK
jgi:hypothetical protein